MAAVTRYWGRICPLGIPAGRNKSTRDLVGKMQSKDKVKVFHAKTPKIGYSKELQFEMCQRKTMFSALRVILYSS
jgi:hypothetical protein